MKKKKDNFQILKADLWSIGILIYKLYFNEYPFDFNEKTTFEIANKIFKEKQLKVPKENDLANLLNKLLVIDPYKRISYEDYFSHSFFK